MLYLIVKVIALVVLMDIFLIIDALNAMIKMEVGWKDANIAIIIKVKLLANTVKKVISLVLALCLTLVLVLASAENEELTGSWYTEMFGTPVELVLNEDGTATMSGSEFTWEKTDTGIKIIGNGTTIEGSLTDGVLTLSEEGMTFSFTREKPVAIVLAEPKTDAVLEDFNGTYAIAYVKAFETYMPAEKAIGMGLMAIPNIVIENGAISLGEMEQTREDDITVAMFSLITQAPAELKDGKLVSSPSTEFLSPEFSITLLQDGMISLEMLGGGEVLLSVIFAPVTEEAAAE